MSYEKNSEGPSCPKSIKLEDVKPLSVEINELSDVSFSDFSSDSDDDYANDFSDGSDMECTDEEAVTQENITWRNSSESMNMYPFQKSESLLLPVSKNDPIDYFRHILTDDILDDIIIQTNVYAYALSSNLRQKKRTWKGLTRDEMSMFLGLVLHMGIIQLERIQDYWKSDPLFGLRVFRNNMSKNRFLLLLKTLRFSESKKTDEVAFTDRLYKIRKVINYFNTRMSEIYYPGREIILDESVVMWRGQLVFQQNIPNKHHKSALKLHHMITSDGIVQKFIADFGAKSPAEKIAIDLLDRFLNVGHSVYMDSNYTSFELAKYLSDKNTHCTGILKSNRKTFLKEFQEKRLVNGETIARYSNDIMVAKWKDKKEFSYISNEHINSMVNVENERHETVRKPLPIVLYNIYMPGVDKKDEMLANYPFQRKILKGPLKLFLHILQLVVINSHCLYKKYSGNDMTLHQFRVSVIKSLIGSPYNAPAVLNESGEHLLRPREQGKNGKTLRKQCRSCHYKGRRKDTMYVCTVCEGSPGYCLECATVTHKF